MKKKFTAGLTCIAILVLGTYVYLDKDSTSKTNKQKYEVPFEDTKLIKSEKDEKTGVQIDVYTIEEWEK